jgi:hypothetical protein
MLLKFVLNDVWEVNMAKKTVPEKNKKPGVCYAFSDDGLELPVIDLTHPSFATAVTSERLKELEKQFVRQQEDAEKAPGFMLPILYFFLGMNSTLFKAINNAGKGFLGGIHTYIMKLGSEHMGEGYTTRIDRTIMAALPSTAMRIRLESVARMTSEYLKPLLKAGKNAVFNLVNIAGGPCPDSINVLLMLNKAEPGLLKGRKIVIHALDLVEAGPSFADRAVKALTETGCPLAGLDISLKFVKYDWADTTALAAELAAIKAEKGIVAVTSEGGLFEYGNDKDIVSNLKTIKNAAISNTAVCGSVTDDGEMIKVLKKTSKAPTIQRSREAFSAMAKEAGWEVKAVEQGTFSRNVLMV